MHLLTILLWCLASNCIQALNSYNAKSWKDAGAYLSQYMDVDAKPCADFAKFVCGKFGNASNTKDYQSWEQERTKIYMNTLEKAIMGIDMNDTRSPKYAVVIRSFYEDCMKYQLDDSAWKSMYPEVAKHLGHVPAFSGSDNEQNNGSVDDLWHLMGKIQREFAEVMALRASFDIIVDNDGRKYGQVSLTPLLPKIRNVNYIRNLTLIASRKLNFTIDWAHFEEIFQETQYFLDDWTTSVSEPESEDDYEYNGTIAGNLTNDYPNITWTSYWRGLLTAAATENWLGDNATVMVVNPTTLTDLSNVFNRHPIRAIKTALYAGFIKSFLTLYNPAGLQDRYWLTGDSVSRRPLCLEYAIQHMSPAAARVYFDHIGEDIIEWRNQILLIARNIFSAMRFLLNSIDYLSLATKERVNEKIDAIVVNPGIPSWIMNETAVLTRSGDYNHTEPLFLNNIRRTRQRYLREMTKLVDPNNIEEPVPKFEQNDYYVPRANNIRIDTFLGDNLPPQFSLNAPMAHKYGTLGFTLGHELMHAFDPGNLYFNVADEDTNLEEDEREIYARHKQCLIGQYSRRCYGNVRGCLAGTKAIKDNVADVGGLKAAYAAYQFVKNMVGDEPSVPGLSNFTSDQLFWISFQRYYCARNPSRSLIVGDHTPNTDRAKIALRNNPHFAEAFKCEVGSDAAPLEKCHMWGDILSSLE